MRMKFLIATAMSLGIAGIDAGVANATTDHFMKAAKVPVHGPLLERTMEFDGAGKCLSGRG